MLPNGIGLFFSTIANGVTTISYYASKTKTLLLNNAGIVTSVAVGSYLFPRQAVAALGGVVASTGANWIAREVDDRYRVHIANIHSGLLDQLPANAIRGYSQARKTIVWPSEEIYAYTQDKNRRFYFINDIFLSELLAPIYEECVYRGSQYGLTMMMQALARIRHEQAAEKARRIRCNPLKFGCRD